MSIQQSTPPSDIDPIGYWTHRAQVQGFAAVMWHQNESLRTATHGTQEALITRFLPMTGQRKHALDVACGVGRMEPLLSKHFERVTAFDLEPMVQQARSISARPNVEYVASTIGAFEYGVHKYDFVLMLGALVASCRVGQLPQLLNRLFRAMKPGGRLLMLEPFHPKPPLARYCRCHPKTVVDLATDVGFHLIHHGGVHLAFLRQFLTNHPSALKERLTPLLYPLGELALSLTSPRRFGDYQVIVFDAPYPVVPFLNPGSTADDRREKLSEVQATLKNIKIYDPGEPPLSDSAVGKPAGNEMQKELAPLALAFNDLGLVRAGQLPEEKIARLYVPGQAKGLKAWELIDKRVVWELANKHFPADFIRDHVAWTIFYDGKVTLSDLQDCFQGTGGIILKPAAKDLYDSFIEIHGAKVIRAPDVAQAYNLAVALLAKGFPTILQEELSLDDQESVWLFRGQGQFHGVVSRTCGMFPRLGGTAYWTRTVQNDELLELSAKMLSLLEFNGYGELEFQRAANGNYKWNLELNPRCWRQWTCALDAGLPLVNFLLMDHYGYTIPATLQQPINAGWFSFGDLISALKIEKSWRKRINIVTRLLIETDTKEWHQRQCLLRILCHPRSIRRAAVMCLRKLRGGGQTQGRTRAVE
jgi:SAM-dependent methyltransferase